MTALLGDLVTIISGFPFASELFNDQKGIPIARIRDVVRGRSETFYDGPFEDTYVLSNGDLLVGMDGEFNSAIWQGGKAVLNQRVCKLIPDTSKLNFDYLKHILPKRLKEIEARTPFVTVKHLSLKEIRAIQVDLPSLEEQKRIAAILDKADSLRRKRQQAIRLADDFLRAVFLDMFGDPVTNSRKWPEKEIYEIAKVTTGNTPSREMPENFGSAIEWIKSDNINTPSHWLTKATEGLSEQGLSLGRTVPAGSTLMTCIAGSPSCIGNVAMADRQVAFNQQINALTPFEGTEPEFLYGLLLYSKQRVQAASTNSMKGMVSKGALERVRLIWPSADLQSAYAMAFKKITALREKQLESDSSPLFSSLQVSLLS